MTIGWAGWNHAERAHVLMGLVEDRAQSVPDGTASVIPLLAGLVELLPWLRQWHSTAELPPWENSPAEEARAYLEKQQDQRGL